MATTGKENEVMATTGKERRLRERSELAVEEEWEVVHLGITECYRAGSGL